MNIKKIITIHIILFLITLIAFTLIFSYPLPIISLSSSVIICIYLVALMVIGILSVFFKKNTFLLKLISSILLATTTSFIYFILLLNYLGNANWGTNVTFNFIVKYTSQLSKLEETLPLPLSIVYIAIAIVIISLIFIYYKLINNIINPIRSLIVEISNLNILTRKTIYSFLSLLLIPILIFSYHYTHSNQVESLWTGEPFTDLLLPHATITLSKKRTATELNSNNLISKTKNITDKPNIILIMADALRADHMGIYGYERPTTEFIDGLVTENNAIKVENAFSTCAESNCGILSSLSSRPFQEISPENIKVNNVLKENGYSINFILSADHSWAGLKNHYPPYDLFYDGNSNDKYANTDDQLVLERLEHVPASNKPSFFYFHLMSNHQSGIRKKQFSQYTPSKSPHDWFYRLPIIKNIFDTDIQSLETNYYDNGIISTDYYISQIFEKLTNKGYMENSIVWILADHGEALGEHGHYGHLQSLYNEEIKIPMIILDKKHALYKETDFATQLDIAPTILDRLGIEIPPGWRGKSLLKKKDGDQISHHNVPDRKGSKAIIMKSDNKQIYKMLYEDDPFEITGIFNLSEDKKEETNLNNIENKWLVEKFKNQIESLNNKISKNKNKTYNN